MKEKIKESKILIFFNDQFLTDIYKGKFLQAGFEIEAFSSYVNPNVVDLVTQEKPDILICDIIVGTNEEMERIDGFNAIKLLKADSRTKDIPIFVLSNISDKETIRKCLEFGAGKYLVMADYSPKEVVEEIKRYLLKK